MFGRSFSWTPRHSQQAAGLLFFAALVLVALTVLGMEARADDGKSVSTSTAPSPAMLQVARSPSSAGHHEEAGNAAGPATFDMARPQDESQPVSQGLNLNLDMSLDRTGELQETVDDGERDTARTARIASCYDASLGRYRSEARGTAFADPLSRTTELDTAMTRFTAERASRRQFDACTRY